MTKYLLEQAANGGWIISEPTSNPGVLPKTPNAFTTTDDMLLWLDEMLKPINDAPPVQDMGTKEMKPPGVPAIGSMWECLQNKQIYTVMDIKNGNVWLTGGEWCHISSFHDNFQLVPPGLYPRSAVVSRGKAPTSVHPAPGQEWCDKKQ